MVLTRNHDVDFLAEYRARIVLGNALVRARIFRTNVVDPVVLARGEVVHWDAVLQPLVHRLGVTWGN